MKEGTTQIIDKKLHKMVYSSLEVLPIYNFDKLISGDLSMLYRTDSSRILNEETLEKIWEKLYNDFCKVTESNGALFIYTLACELVYLKSRKDNVKILLQEILKYKPESIMKKYYEALADWGFYMNQRKDFKSEFERLEKQWKVGENKIKRKQSEYEELVKDKGEAISLLKQKTKLESFLKMSIDITKISVMEWLAYWDEAENISKKNTKKR